MADTGPLTHFSLRSGETSIDVEGVTHFFSKSGPTVLDDINLNLETGFYGLLGVNGAGKSSLMRIICTLLEPKQGSVRVNGLDTIKDCLAIRGQIGYLPQSFSAWRLYRTEEVLDALARMSGVTDKRLRKLRVQQVLEEVGLDQVADRKVKKLSGGMVRRLGVAQALVHDPGVLVVDEPTVGLDPEERIRFRHLMAELGQNRTILCSTHIVSDLGSGCKEIALLDDGKIAFQDSPDAFINQAQGRVFEMQVDLETSMQIEETYEIVSRETLGEQVKLRLVIDRAASAPDGATPVDSSTLEEAYLAFMGSIGKFAAVRADEEADLQAEQSDKKKSRRSKKERKS
ncbi:MAG: ATP-binding cassette domain-containing protein [Gammaproteobacteria bacterium]|nr:ATP-binding cassette domain-containing protein [Gammaproteobacteria bacterium]